MRKITAASVCITTKCSRQCPDCCCKHPEIWDADPAYIENLFWTIGYPNRVHVTGGEPAECPSFHNISHYLYVMAPSWLTVETARFHDSLKFYDEIYFSFYGDNEKELEQVKQLCSKHERTLHIGKIRHLPDVPGTGEVCHRGTSELVAIFQDRMYPCCVGPGIPGAEYVPVSREAKDAVLEVPLPCDRCRFSGKG